MEKLRILVADDHEAIRLGVRAIIDAEADMTVIGEAADGEEAADKAEALAPDVVVMDISMPRLNGLEATVRIRERCPAVKVLAYTRHAEDGYLKQLLRAGATGYLLKQSPRADLVRAIRTVAAGDTYVDATLAARMVPGLTALRTAGRPGRPDTDLTAREEEVLRLVAWAYSNQDIAERLQVSVKTVETHKSKAMRRLGLHARRDVVRFALLKGWLEED